MQVPTECPTYIISPLGGATLEYLIPQTWATEGTPIDVSLGLISRLQNSTIPKNASAKFLAGWITADAGLHDSQVRFVQ